jgi:DNA-binding response OmpR family regulator
MWMEGMDPLDIFTVLVVEGEESLRRVITLSLQELGLRVFEAPDLRCARELLKTEHPDLLVLELDFPNDHNCELIELFRKQRGQDRGSVVVTTTQRTSDDWRRRNHPEITLFKPFDMRLLCKSVTALLTGDHDGGVQNLLRNRMKK